MCIAFRFFYVLSAIKLNKDVAIVKKMTYFLTYKRKIIDGDNHDCKN